MMIKTHSKQAAIYKLKILILKIQLTKIVKTVYLHAKLS